MARGQFVRGFDIVPTSQASESVIGDIASYEVVRSSMEGIGTLIHLAATPDDDDFPSRLLPNNIVGTFNIIESARDANVRRVILASTGQVVWWQRMRAELPIDEHVPPTPRGWYAATKCFLEAAGCSLAEGHGREVIAVRLGWCPRTREHVQELAASTWAQDVYLSPGDAGRFFACAALAENTWRYEVLYASSRHVEHLTYDLTRAQELIGFVPQDTWPQGVEDMT
jgi:nucleoside-diphosphate-sugar epimerase